MKKATDIRERIKDPDLWPSISESASEHLSELEDIADSAFEKHTVEGYLAALLIYHQLSEELLKILIEDCQFFIRASVYPLNIDFPTTKKAMYGKSLEHLRRSVDFENRDIFIQKCQELNLVRNKTVHGLTKTTSVEEVRKNLEQVKTLFYEIYRIWDYSHDWFRQIFSDFKDQFENLDHE